VEVAVTEFEPAVLALARPACARRRWIATAESCTGGLIAAACTPVAGSSDWFERGFVTYSNEAKTECSACRGADQAHGAVSERSRARDGRGRAAPLACRSGGGP
jgi:nicotinamide-nucleotide amidase